MSEKLRTQTEPSFIKEIYWDQQSLEQKIDFLKEKYPRPDQHTYLEALGFFLNKQQTPRKALMSFITDRGAELSPDFPANLNSRFSNIDTEEKIIATIHGLSDVSVSGNIKPAQGFVGDIISHANDLCPLIQGIMNKRQNPIEKLKATVRSFKTDTRDTLQELELAYNYLSVFRQKVQDEITINPEEWSEFCFNLRVGGQEFGIDFDYLTDL